MSPLVYATLPVQAGGKVPLVQRGQYSPMTTVPGQVIEQTVPGLAQVAYVCSPSTGLAVIDVDHPQELAGSATGRWLAARGARPYTTRGDHAHYYVDARGVPLPGQCPTITGDWKYGGYVVAPGGVHPTGMSYLRGPGGVTPADEELAAAITADRRARAGAGGGGAAGAVTVRWHEDTGPGTLGTRIDLLHAAASMWELGWDDEEILAELTRVAVAQDPARPWTDGDLETIAREGPVMSQRNGHRHGGALAVRATDAWMAAKYEEGQRQQAAQPAPEGPVPGARRFTRVKASSRTAKPVPWLWEPYLVRGALNLLAGYEGAGKSMVATWLVAQVTRGRWGQPPATVLVVATEDDWDSTIQPRLMAAGADLDLVEQLVPPEGAAELILPDDCAALEEEVSESGASLVVLDPLLSRVAERFDTHKDAEVRQALEPLKRVLERRQCATLGLLHWNKSSTSRNPLDRLMASRAFSAVTRSTLAVAPHPENPNAKVLAHAKSNVGVHGAAMTFEIAAWTDPGDARITAGYVRFLDKLEEFDLSEAFDVKKPKKSDVTTVAAAFVRWVLDSHGGAVATGDMLRAALAEGISERALKMPAVKILANAEVRQVPGVAHAYAWCQAGLEPPVMMAALARAGGHFRNVGMTDHTQGNGHRGVSSLSVGSVLPTTQKTPPAREAAELTPDQQALLTQIRSGPQRLAS